MNPKVDARGPRVVTGKRIAHSASNAAALQESNSEPTPIEYAFKPLRYTRDVR